jgi:hypothetical protein
MNVRLRRTADSRDRSTPRLPVMTAIAITAFGPVTGSNSTLVSAAAALIDAIPQPRGRMDRIAELVAAVRLPLDALL